MQDFSSSGGTAFPTNSNRINALALPFNYHGWHVWRTVLSRRFRRAAGEETAAFGRRYAVWLDGTSLAAGL
jgi:hypothetical protein